VGLIQILPSFLVILNTLVWCTQISSKLNDWSHIIKSEVFLVLIRAVILVKFHMPLFRQYLHSRTLSHIFLVIKRTLCAWFLKELIKIHISV
jgi:hypothetical protein